MTIWVIKVGTSVISSYTGEFDESIAKVLVEGIAHLRSQGIKVVLVSSGAVACGKEKLVYDTTCPTDSHLQMRGWAAVGQAQLMSHYLKLLEKQNIVAAQVLVTDPDFELPEKAASIREMLQCLLQQGVLPILNENDAITTRTTHYRDGEGKILWDNDSLATLVAACLSADRLILLSNIPGVLAKGKGHQVIRFWETDTPDKVAPLGTSSYGRGGIIAKIESACRAAGQGIQTHIASGREAGILVDLLEGKPRGTLFVPHLSIPQTSASPCTNTFQKAQDMARTRLRGLDHTSRIKWLERFRQTLQNNYKAILEANLQDLKEAKSLEIATSLQKRLSLTESKWEALLLGIETLKGMPDPVGKIEEQRSLKNPFRESERLHWQRCCVPLGLVLVIFESRPDVLVQLLALAIKTGNGMVCKGGKEARHTLMALYHCFILSCEETEGKERNLADGFQLLLSREEANQALQSDCFDLCIPRGSASFIQWVKKRCSAPVIGHGSGICCGYLHSDLDPRDREVQNLVGHAKLDYPAACNALEVLFIHRSHLEAIDEAIEDWEKQGIQIRLGKGFNKYPKDYEIYSPEEHGDNRLLIELVATAESALEQMNRYGSHHTDLVITRTPNIAELFFHGLMASSVFQNVSTRCADGFRMGMGCEIGINTTRSSWFRGPVGIEGLLTTQIQLKPI